MRKILLFLAFLALCVHHARADEISLDITSTAGTTWSYDSSNESSSPTSYSGYTGYDGASAYEYYIASSSSSWATIPLYKTISGLDAGEYTVSFYATAHLSYWSGSGAWTDTSGSSSLSGYAYAFATTGGTTDLSAAKTENLPIWYATSLTSEEPYTFSFTVDVEEDDDLTIGIYVTQTAMYANWFTAQIISLTQTVEVGDDVTSTYLTDPGFENSTAVTSDVGTSTSFSDTGEYWTAVSSGWATGGVVAYGSNLSIGSTTYGIVPSTGWDEETISSNKNALGVASSWGGYCYYENSSAITWPAGDYTVLFHVYNASTSATTIATNYTGFLSASGTGYYCSNLSFSSEEWTTEAVTFTLDEETSGYITLGSASNSSSGIGGSAILYYDDITIYYTAPATTYDISDYVVGSPNWGFEETTASTVSFSGSYDHGDYTDTGWTAITNDIYGRGGVLAYGSSLYCNSSTYGIVPETGWDETTITDNKNTLGMGCSWASSLAYSSDTISLPAGTYKMSVHTYNSSTAATSITTNLTGFVTLDGTTYYIDKTSFTSSTWETSSVEFTLTEETVGYVSVGIQGPNATAGSCPVIYFDDITLATETEYSDESPITTIGTLTADIDDGETLAEGPTSISFGWVGGWTTSTSLSTSSIGALSTSTTATLTASGSSTSTSVTLTYDSDTGLFTADLSSVTFSKDVVYTLTIPDGIYGWSGTSNEETTISFSITSFETGTYVFQVKDEYKYLSHGGSWGTQAVAGEMGIPFTVELASGGYTLLNFNQTVNAESNKYVYLSGSNYYVDGSSPAYWQIESTDTEGEYYLLTTGGDYLSVSDEVEYSDYYHYQSLTTVSSKDDAVVWVLHEQDADATDGMSAFESYYETLAEMKDAQAAETAELAGLSGVTSMEDMASLSGYTEYDRTWAIQNAEMGSTTGWSSTGCGSGTSVNTFSTYTSDYISSGGMTYLRNVPSSAGTFYQTISDLPDGIYKVSAVGGYNASSDLLDIVVSSVSGVSSLLKADGLSDEEKLEISPAWLYANSSSQRTIGLADGYQGNVGEVSTSDLLKALSGGLDMSSYLTAFKDSFYVYVGEGESLTIGGIDPGSSDTTIILAANWELTFLSDVPCKLGSYTVSIEDSASLSVFDSLTVSYPYAWTVDSTTYESRSVLSGTGASLYVGSSTEAAATGTVTLTDDGFTVTFSDYTFLGGVAYTITIAANTYGYVSNSTVSGAANEEITITFYIPSVEDGVYYLKAVTDDDEDEDEYSYLSHGSSWGTRATADSYGLPVQVEAGWDGATFYFADNQGYLFDNGDATVYTDGSTSKYYNWSVVQSSENDTCYVIVSSNDGSSSDGYYLSISDEGNADLVSSEDDATLWYFESPTEHKAVMQTYKDDQAATAASDAGITTTIASASELATWLSENRTEVDITLNETVSSISESWQKNAGAPSTSSSSVTGYGLVSDEVTLSEGLYKLSLQGFTRYASNSVTETLEGARSLVFLRVTVGENTYETQLLSVLDYLSTTALSTSSDETDYTGTTGDYSGYYFPNGTSGASAAFSAEYYPNDVYFYVSDDNTEVSIALTDEHVYAADANEWICWQYLTLTRYASESTTDTCYLRTTDDDGNYLYLSRGADYNSRIIADEYGLPVQVTTSDGITTLYFFDNQQYVYEPLDGTVYGDASTNVNWTLAQNEDETGYYLRSANTTSSYNGYYVALDDDGYFTLSTTDSTLWTLEEPADHNDNANAAYDRQALSVASSAGIDITSISTRDALAEYLAANYVAVSVDLTTTQEDVTEDYQGGATYGGGYSFNTLATQTATLSEGLYKFSVQGFHRFTWNETTEALGGARGQVFLYAGSEKVNVLSPFDYAASSYTATGIYQSGDAYYPNDSVSASEAFDAGYYPNDVYFYVSTDATEVTLALIDEQGYGSVDIGQWTCWKDFTLEKYSETVDVTVSAGGYATLYYGDYDLQVPDGMTAYVVSTEDSVDADNEVVYLTAIEDGIIPKGTGVVLGADAGDYELSVTTTTNTIENNLLKGTDVATLVSDGTSSDTYYYVLSYASDDTEKTGSMGFYVQKSGGTYLYNNAHKAYLPLSASTSNASVKGFSFVTTDGTTGISSVESSEGATVKGIYTLTGIRLDSDVSSLPAGLYIIDGKKTLIHK